jgi:hypothetical protein
MTKGITLSYGADSALKKLTNLQEIPDLGGDTDAIEITTLDDEAHTYMDGLKNYGDSLPFKFLYEKEQFAALNALTGIQQWKVELPDGTSCTFSGTCSVKLTGSGVNGALAYTLAIKPNSKMIWA